LSTLENCWKPLRLEYRDVEVEAQETEAPR
jgi:hypothetical protein